MLRNIYANYNQTIPVYIHIGEKKNCKILSMHTSGFSHKSHKLYYCINNRIYGTLNHTVIRVHACMYMYIRTHVYIYICIHLYTGSALTRYASVVRVKLFRLMSKSVMLLDFTEGVVRVVYTV